MPSNYYGTLNQRQRQINTSWLMVEIMVADGSRTNGWTLINITLADLLSARRLVIHNRDN